MLELNRTQQLIARRMSFSRATVPSFEVETEVERCRPRRSSTAARFAGRRPTSLSRH